MRRIRFWLRLGFYPIFLAAVLALLATCFVVEDVAGVVSWFAARSLPGFSLHIAKAEFAGATRIEFNQMELRRRRQDKAVLTLGAAAVDYSVADLWRHHVANVEMDGLRLAVDGETLLAFFASKKKAATVSSRPGKGEPWQVDRFSIHAGKGDIDIPAFPKVHIEFAAELRGLRPGPETRETQMIELKNIQVVSRDPKPKPLVEAKAFTVLFTMDQLARQRLQEVIISSPAIHLQPALLTALAALAPASQASPASQGPSAAAGWQLGRLNIKDGEFFSEGFGASIPVASAKFAIDTTDIGFGGTGEKMHTVQLWDVRSAPPFDPLHPFLELDSVTISFSDAGLNRNEVAKIETTGLWIGYGRSLRSFAALSGKNDTSHAANDQQRPWMVRDLSIQSGYVALSDIGLGIPDLGFYVRTQLNDVALSGDARFAGDQIQTVELSNISIHSPLDPFVPVLSLKTIFVRFSIARLLHDEIEEVSILNPQIFVGEDLFWYADALKKQNPAAASNATPATPASTPAAAHWIVKNLGADFGEIVIANGGVSRATLPLTFSWRAQNVDFNNLDDLQLKLKLVIPEGDYRLPAYQLELTDLSGKIEFGLPPEAHKDNLVHTLQAKEVRWQQFVAQRVFTSVTYDKQGIYGEVGGAAYGGYLAGGFSFFTQPDSPWTGWISGSKVNLRGVTDALAPQSLQLSGPADFKLEVNGLNHEIERLKGSYTMRTPGKLRVTKVDDLLGRLPRDWTVLKSSLARIGLETLRDFDYDSGNGSFWFANDEGDIQLALEGPSGSRKLEAVLHGAREPTR